MENHLGPIVVANFGPAEEKVGRVDELVPEIQRWIHLGTRWPRVWRMESKA